MDGPEPDTTPFDAITAQGNRISRVSLPLQTLPVLQCDNFSNIVLTGIPKIPRRLHPLRPATLGRHRRSTPLLLPPHPPRPRLVHRRLLPGHLPAQPLPRLPPTEIRPISERRRGARRWRIITKCAPDETRRGVPSVHSTITRIQVLAFRDEGDRGFVPVQFLRGL